MSTSATTVRKLSLLAVSKGSNGSCSSMRNKRKKSKSINHHQHLNLFSTLKSSVDNTKAMDDQSSDDDCTDKSSSSNSVGNNESKSSVLEHYESLVNSGEVSKDIHQIRALSELDRLRNDCLSYINSHLFHEGATDNNHDGSGNIGSDVDAGGWSISTSNKSLFIMGL